MRSTASSIICNRSRTYVASRSPSATRIASSAATARDTISTSSCALPVGSAPSSRAAQNIGQSKDRADVERRVQPVALLQLPQLLHVRRESRFVDAALGLLARDARDQRHVTAADSASEARRELRPPNFANSDGSLMDGLKNR